MQLSSQPTKFQLAFGADASAGNIRAIPLTTPDPNAASLTVGFPPSSFAPVGAGGVPPDGRDMNGILNQSTAWNQWLASGVAFQPYDATYQGVIGGYPKLAIVASVTTADTFWLCTTDNNTTNPDTGGAGWIAFPGASSIPWGSPPQIGNVTPNSIEGTVIAATSRIVSNGPISGSDLQINGVGFTTSLGQSGVQRLPTGLILQWARLFTPTGNGDFIAFPQSFPNNCSIAMDIGNDGSGSIYNVNGALSGPPYTGVTVYSWRAGSIIANAGVSYIAVGN